MPIYLNNALAWANVRDYGAKGDVRKYADGAITTGTAAFTSATATFTTADVGKTITISGAGAAGIMHVTTISAYVSATAVTLAANAGTTVSGKLFGFGTNDSGAFTTAINAMNAQPNGGVVYVPPGIYGFATEVVHKLNVVIRGAGMDVATVYLLGDIRNIFQEPNAGVAANTFMGVEDITLWGSMDRNPTQDTNTGTLGAGNRLSVLRADRVWWKRVHAIYGRQMSLTGVGGSEGRAEECVVEKGGRDGINLTGSTSAVFVGNSLSELPDDGIAFHIVAGLAIGTIASPSCTIVGNKFYKCSGIKILGATNATITGNSGRFMSGYGVYMDYDATFGEGNKDTIGVSICGNSFMDIINLYVLTAGVQNSGYGIYVASPIPQQGPGGRSVTNGSTTATSTNLTSATIAWVTGDIGKSVSVTGAGPAGATLVTRIMSISSGTVAVMETAASTTVAGTATITLSLLPYFPAMTTAGTGTVAIKGPSANAWNGVSGAATGGYNLLVSGNTLMQTLDGLKTDGTPATNFSDYGFGNLWWTSGSQDFALANDMGNLITAYQVRGISLTDGASRDPIVVSNAIYGFQAGVHISSNGAAGIPQRPSAVVKGNKIVRCNRGLSIEYPGSNQYVNISFIENDCNLDPLFESSERTAASGQPTGGWTKTTGNTAVGVYTDNQYGVLVARNTFRNTCNLTTRGGTEGVTLVNNTLYADATGTIAGVGANADELGASLVIPEISDPRLVTYGQQTTAVGPAAITAAACPTTGMWFKGAFVHSTTLTESGGAVIYGWLRMTTGTGNVYGTDWMVINTTGGRLVNNSTALQTKTSGDSYITGSNITIPTYRLLQGYSYHLRFDVTKTAAGTGTPTVVVRYGTAGTTADTARLTFTFAAGTAVADTGIFEFWATFRNVGAAAVLAGTAQLVNNLTITGLSNAVKSLAVVSGTFDSGVANSIIGASYNGGVSSSHAIQLVSAELIPG